MVNRSKRLRKSTVGTFESISESDDKLVSMFDMMTGFTSLNKRIHNIEHNISSDSLLSKLGIQNLDVVLSTSRMRWFGHVERSTGWIATVRKLNVVAKKRPGRRKKTWDEVDDRKKLGMDSADPQNRSEWRGRLRGRLVSVEPSSLLLYCIKRDLFVYHDDSMTSRTINFFASAKIRCKFLFHQR